jgi:hypothetical protein
LYSVVEFQNCLEWYHDGSQWDDSVRCSGKHIFRKCPTLPILTLSVFAHKIISTTISRPIHFTDTKRSHHVEWTNYLSAIIKIVTKTSCFHMWFISHFRAMLPRSWCAASRCCEIVVLGCSMCRSLLNPFFLWLLGALSSGPLPCEWWASAKTKTLCEPDTFHNHTAKLAASQLAKTSYTSHLRESKRELLTERDIQSIRKVFRPLPFSRILLCSSLILKWIKLQKIYF